MARSILFGIVPIMVILSIMVVEMATDMYAPVMPIMMNDFGVAEYAIQATITADLLGLALAGIVFGPLSDTFGRRPIMLTGIIIFTIAAVLCAIAPTLESLLAFRFIQGLGSGTVIVVGSAAIKDKFDDAQMARIISFIGMVIAISPGVAPIIGGYIGSYISWRGIFVTLTLAGAALLAIMCFRFPETLHKKEPLRLRHICRNYLATLRHKVFMAYAMLIALAVAVWWVELSNLPFLFEQWGVPTQHYGYYFSSLIICYVLGTIVNQACVIRVGIDHLLLTGTALKCISVVCIAGFTFVGAESPIGLLLCMYPGAFGMGLFFGNAFSKALSVVTNHVGIASALMTLSQMIVAGIAISIVGHAYNGTTLPLAGAEIAWMVLSVLLFVHIRRSNFR